MGIVRRSLNATSLPKLSPRSRARLDELTAEQIESNAEADSDNPPLTDEELRRARMVRLVRSARAATGLSQSAFASRLHLSLPRLRDWEQGRYPVDPFALYILELVERDPGYFVGRPGSDRPRS